MIEVKQTVIKKDSFFVFSQGSYSGYQCSPLCKATTDIDPAKEMNEYLSHGKSASCEGFKNWILNVKKLAIEIDCTEFYLGDWELSLQPLRDF